MEKQKNDPSRDEASHVDVHDKDFVPQNVDDQNFNCCKLCMMCEIFDI